LILVTGVHPEVLVLDAGATARMGRLDRLSWADFTATWETDVKAGLYWMPAALNLPLAPGARVLVGSSGAAEQGSLLSGGYAGGKRTLWIMAKYANGVAKQKGLGIRFQAGGTGVGDAEVVGAPDRIRTCDLCLRRATDRFDNSCRFEIRGKDGAAMSTGKLMHSEGCGSRADQPE
jgi:hypothetical protein